MTIHHRRRGTLLRPLIRRVPAASLAVLLAWTATPAPAQTPAAGGSALPGVPVGAAPLAPLADGQPNVQGYWQAIGPGGLHGLNVEFLKDALPPGIPGMGPDSPSLVIDPPDGRVPYQPWARVRRDEVAKDYMKPGSGQVDTRTRGWPDGVPRISYYGVNPFQILQVKDAVLLLYEAQHEFRYIPLDGRPHPDPGVHLWMGSSRGRWEGRTLVVEVRNVTDRTRLSVMGDFHSENATITERWEFVDANTIRHTAVIEDPAVYTRPWTVTNTIKRVREPGFELMEYSGVEGDKDAANAQYLSGEKE